MTGARGCFRWLTGVQPVQCTHTGVIVISRTNLTSRLLRYPVYIIVWLYIADNFLFKERFCEIKILVLMEY